MPIDPSIPLGVKVPDQMSLSSLLGAASTAQNMQLGSQKIQDNAISLGERQGLQQFMSNPSNYTDKDGNVDFNAAMSGVMKVAPTTGLPVVQNLLTAQKQHVEATSALSKLDDDNRTRVANVLSTIPPDAPADVVNQSFEALGKAYGGKIDPWITLAKQGYTQAQQKGPQAVADYLTRAARSVLPQETQQRMDTPEGSMVDDGQHIVGLNQKPGVRGYSQGSPMFSVQKQLPPTTPTVGPNNQPGYVGPQGGDAMPPNLAFANSTPQQRAAMSVQSLQKEIALAQAANDPPQAKAERLQILNQELRKAQAELGAGGAAPAPAPATGFVPSGPVPGANESKGGTIQVNNDHWAKLNQQAESSQTLESVIQNIKALAPKAVTGTLAGRTAFVNGALNALHLGDKISGDLQKDTDLLEKNMAQLNLGTPAATDAMRTIVGAARPHGTMNAGAIEEAADQLMGQIRANRAVRNALTVPKRIQDQKGDPTAYTHTRQHMEELADPRIFQYEAMPAGPARTAFLRKQPDAAALIKKTQALIEMGVLK